MILSLFLIRITLCPYIILHGCGNTRFIRIRTEGRESCLHVELLARYHFTKIFYSEKTFRTNQRLLSVSSKCKLESQNVYSLSQRDAKGCLNGHVKKKFSHSKVEIVDEGNREKEE